LGDPGLAGVAQVFQQLVSSCSTQQYQWVTWRTRQHSAYRNRSQARRLLLGVSSLRGKDFDPHFVLNTARAAAFTVGALQGCHCTQNVDHDPHALLKQERLRMREQALNLCAREVARHVGAEHLLGRTTHDDDGRVFELLESAEPRLAGRNSDEM